MTKLTEAQKQENKEARRLRDQAFKLRRAAYETARQKAKDELEASSLNAERLQANSALNVAQDEAAAEEARIRAEIAKLQAQLANVRIERGIEALNNARVTTNDAYYRARRQAENAVDAAYPDVANVYSAAEWEGKGHYKPAGSEPCQS